MIAYLRGMASDLKQMSKDESEIKPFTDEFIESAAELEKEISIKEWTISDIRIQKEELGNTNAEYLHALNRGESFVFVRKFPNLFK